MSLSKPSRLNPHAVTSVKRILLFKVKKIESHELQKESNAQALFLFDEITKCSFLKCLAKTLSHAQFGGLISLKISLIGET